MSSLFNEWKVFVPSRKWIPRTQLRHDVSNLFRIATSRPFSSSCQCEGESGTTVFCDNLYEIVRSVTRVFEYGESPSPGRTVDILIERSSFHVTINGHADSSRNSENSLSLGNSWGPCSVRNSTGISARQLSPASKSLKPVCRAS